MIGAVGGSPPSGHRWSAVRWFVIVAVVWAIFAAERLFAYRAAGFGAAVLVLHGVGWVTAILVTVSCVVIAWRRARRSLAAAAVAVGLLSAGVISVVDWRAMHARDFYREHRQDFATLVVEVRQGRYSSDTAGGSQLSGDLAYLSGNELVGAVGAEGKFVLFLPVWAAKGDGHRNGAGAVRGCALGYLNTSVDMPPFVEDYEACAGRMSLGDGWYWAG